GAQHLDPHERRLAAAKRIEDVDPGVGLAKQWRHAAVADRHAVGEYNIAGVRLEREPMLSGDADDGERDAFVEIAPPYFVRIRICHRVDLAATRRERSTRTVDRLQGALSRQ